MNTRFTRTFNTTIITKVVISTNDILEHLTIHLHVYI